MPADIIQLKQNSPELISDDVREIITYRPHWIIRQGNVIFLSVMVFLLSLTLFVKYPDIVNASAKLVAVNPPKLVASRVEGKLMKLFVLNNQQVNQGQPLGYIESTADYFEVIKLRNGINELIKSVHAIGHESINIYSLPQFGSLGDLQSIYEETQNEMIQTKQTLAGGYYQAKKAALEKDLQYIAELKNFSSRQKRLLQQDKELQNKEYKAYESLAKDKVIAPLELNQYKSKQIAKEQGLQQADAQITNGEITRLNKQKEILDLQKVITDQQQKFFASLLNLKSQVEKWLRQYELTASEDGKILFVSSLKENELIAGGQPLFYIEPGQVSFYAELMAGQRGVGKIKEGQQVLIKIDGFPNAEFGHLSGNVAYISAIPNSRDSFLIKVNLPHGLKTNYGKPILFRNNLTAQAEIITDNRKLFHRLTGQLKQIWER